MMKVVRLFEDYQKSQLALNFLNTVAPAIWAKVSSTSDKGLNFL